jgi:hypothetical protein
MHAVALASSSCSSRDESYSPHQSLAHAMTTRLGPKKYGKTVYLPRIGYLVVFYRLGNLQFALISLDNPSS